MGLLSVKCTLPTSTLQSKQDMAISSEKEKYAELGHWVKQANYVVWFTGAGISTESGIPDFRGPDGVWTRRDAGLPPPQTRIDPSQIKPNRAHRALVELERLGKADFLISQNVDGLHLDSGFPASKLAELHGNSKLMVCSQCAAKMTLVIAKWDRERWGPGYHGQEQNPGQPSCPECGGRLYSSVVNFGDSLPAGDLEASYNHAQKCDLFVVLGSSLVVAPAADIPGEARQAGAQLVVCNIGDTPYDDVCDLRISANTGDVMDVVLTQLN